MALNVTIELQGNFQHGDLQNFFDAVAGTIYSTNKAPVFAHPKLDLNKNQITCQTALPQPAAHEFIKKALLGMDNMKMYDTPDERTIVRRALGYKVTFAEIPIPAHS